jgi:hypothetical protein
MQAAAAVVVATTATTVGVDVDVALSAAAAILSNSAVVVPKFGNVSTRINTEAKTDRCDVCQKFFSQRGLVNHLMVNYCGQPQQKLFQCDAPCAKQYKSRIALRRHQREDHQQATHQPCAICGKRMSPGSLQRHMKIRSHLNLKQETCNQCGRNFTQSGHLVNHIHNVHGSEFLCSFSATLGKCAVGIRNADDDFVWPAGDVCLERFSTLQELRDHQNVMTHHSAIVGVKRRRRSK